MNVKSKIAISGVLCEEENYKETKDIAIHCGKIIPNYGLDLVIIEENEISKSVVEETKRNGGEVVGIFMDHRVRSTWLYDHIIILKDKGKFFHTIKKTCLGLLAIGLPKDFENLALPKKDFPVAVIVPQSVYHEGCDKLAKNYSIFTNVLDAVVFIIKENYKDASFDPDKAYKNGLDIRNRCYPLGKKGEYLRAATNFLFASFIALAKNNYLLWNKSMAQYFNSLGDHHYYHTEDFLRAASLYSKALAYLKNILQEVDREKDELYYYLRSIIIESVALAFDRIGEIALARVLASASADSYDNAKKYSTKSKLKCYLHTVVGLKAYVKYLEAKEKIQKQDIVEAEELLSEARKLYGKALKYLPLWKESGFSDTYSKTEKEITELESALKRLRGY